MSDDSTPQMRSSRSWSMQWGVALVLGALAFLVYFKSNEYRVLDAVPAEVLARMLIDHHTLYFDLDVTPAQIAARRAAGDEGDYYWYAVHNGHTLSYYPIVPGLLNIPAFLIAKADGIDVVRQQFAISRWTDCVVCALSVSFMFLFLVRVCERLSTAVLMAAVYAFATCVWSVGAEALWQHGPSLLFLTAGLALLVRPKSRWMPMAGFLFGMAVWNRPTNGVFLLPIAIYVALFQRRRFAAFLLLSAIPIVAMFAYSWVYWGSVFALGQGHRMVGKHGGHDIGLYGPLWIGLMGVLFSPSRGLFITTPLFVLAAPGLFLVLKRARHFALPAALAIGAVLHVIVYSKWIVWWGGACFGYRMLLETMPAMVLLLAIAWEADSAKVWRIGKHFAFWPLLMISVYVQFLGSEYYPNDWYGRDASGLPVSADRYPARIWDWSDNQLGRCQDGFFHHLGWK